MDTLLSDYTTEVDYEKASRTDEADPQALQRRIPPGSGGIGRQNRCCGSSKQLGLHESQLYLWRSKTREQSDKSELAQQQMLEIAKLKRQLAERDEELAIIKRQPRTSQKTRSEVRIHPATCSDVQYRGNVSCAGCNPFRLLPMVVATRQSVAYSGAS